MKKLNILVIGKNKSILEVVVRLLNSNADWAAIEYFNEEEVFSDVDLLNFDILLLSCGIDESTERTIKEKSRNQNPKIIIIQHYGGGGGLLKNEIFLALSEAKKMDVYIV